MRDQGCGEVDAETTGEVIVADAGRAELACLRGEGTVSRPVFECNGHDSVEHLGDPGRREAEVAVPAVPYRRNQSRLGELRQMRARGLRRNTRGIGQFGGGKGSAIEKCREHGRSCRLSDQPSNLG